VSLGQREVLQRELEEMEQFSSEYLELTSLFNKFDFMRTDSPGKALKRDVNGIFDYLQESSALIQSVTGVAEFEAVAGALCLVETKSHDAALLISEFGKRVG
jgi:uncharacterized protein YpiB (UPF0302 family)